MDDKKDKGPRGPKGPRGGGDRPKPAGARSGAGAEPRKDGPRQWADKKPGGGAKWTGKKPGGAGPKDGERPARAPGPRFDGPRPANDSRGINPRSFKDFKTPRTDAAGGDKPRAYKPRDEKPREFKPRDDKPQEYKPRTARADGGVRRARPETGGDRRPDTRPARGPGPRRDGPPAANDSRGESPRNFRDFKSPRPAADGAAPAAREYKARPGRSERAGARPDGDAAPARDDARPPRKPFGDRPPRKEFGSDRPPRKDFGGDRPRGKPGVAPGAKFGKPSDPSRPIPRRFRDDAAPPEADADGERIAKRLARAGIASRRDAEELIAAGRVRVNGVVLSSPALNVATSDRIEVDGTEIPPVERTRLFLFNKPAGVVTTNRDPEGRKTVFDVLPQDLPRLITVGRLDINTEGLLLLTNDGGLSRVLELPSTGWLRRYRVRVHGRVDEKLLPGLKDGIAVDGVFYGPIEATLDREQGANAWLTIGLREGKNREVKNVLGALGLEVTRLIRVSFGPFQLGELAEGAVLELKGKMLRDQLGPRLIEESGANFDAPVVNAFSNSPVRRAPEVAAPVEAPKRVRSAEPVGEGGLIKRRREREDRRDNALGRLDTKPGRGGPKSFGKGPAKPGFGSRDKPAFGGRDKPAGRDKDGKGGPIPTSTRKANVWMAPGARPQGKKAEDGPAAGDKPRPRPRDGGQGGPRKGGNADRRR